MVSRTPVILVFAVSQLIPSSVWAQGYFMKDFQYFKPIICGHSCLTESPPALPSG